MSHKSNFIYSHWHLKEVKQASRSKHEGSCVTSFNVEKNILKSTVDFCFLAVIPLNRQSPSKRKIRESVFFPDHWTETKTLVRQCVSTDVVSLLFSSLTQTQTPKRIPSGLVAGCGITNASSSSSSSLFFCDIPTHYRSWPRVTFIFLKVLANDFSDMIFPDFLRHACQVRIWANLSNLPDVLRAVWCNQIWIAFVKDLLIVKWYAC